MMRNRVHEYRVKVSEPWNCDAIYVTVIRYDLDARKAEILVAGEWKPMMDYEIVGQHNCTMAFSGLEASTILPALVEALAGRG